MKRISRAYSVTPTLRQDLILFCILTPLGAGAAFLSVNIPHTEVYIEGRWIFGYLAFALLGRFPLAVLTAIILSVSGFHQVSWHVALGANLLYALPFGFCLRVLSVTVFRRLNNHALLGMLWFVAVFIGYQLFTTPITWLILGILRGKPTPGFIWEGVLSQPYFEESIGVALLSGLCLVIYRMYRDISESRRHMRTILTSIGDAVIVTDIWGRVEMMNPVAVTLTGWKTHEALERPIDEVFRISDARTGRICENPVEKVLLSGRIIGLANHTVLTDRDGTTRPIADSGAPIVDETGQIEGVVMVFRDVTEEYGLRSRIEKELKEKNLLLKEVHHRVKNNLQIISSLLELQFNAIQVESIQQMLSNSKRRIYSMSLVHNQLYDSDNLTDVDFYEYVETLVGEIVDNDGESPEIAVILDIESIRLEIDEAIPCGLLVNELLLNSIQHAFPDGSKGNIRIEMRTLQKDSLELTYRDDGVGIPEDIETTNPESLGLLLIKGLVSQLEGTYQFRRDGGTVFRFTFPYKSKG